MTPAPCLRRWPALALLGTAFFMVILDGTIVYVALPQIARDLGFSTGGVQWVMSAYLLCFGGLLLLGGRCADLLGRRRVFMVGVGLFVCSSLLCGLAWSPAALIGARVVQGVSAAIMAPTALSILMTVFPDGPERNRALGIWGGIGGVGATAGLLLGGPITAAFGWRGGLLHQHPGWPGRAGFQPAAAMTPSRLIEEETYHEGHAEARHEHHRERQGARGLTDEERAAMREHAQELKKAARDLAERLNQAAE